MNEIEFIDNFIKELDLSDISQINEMKTLVQKPVFESARKSFWEFCKLLYPDVYLDKRIDKSKKAEYNIVTKRNEYSLIYTDRKHLKNLCDSLQAFYERRIIKFYKNSEWKIISKEEYKEISKNIKLYPELEVCKKFMLNMPPRHGKSFTLINFCKWCYGQNIKERIMVASYNNELSEDFSRYTRDGIGQEKVLGDEITYSDVFPEVKLKIGDSALGKWSLQGQFISYVGAGIGGTLTGRGGNILIVDDAIKGRDEAISETHLNKVWGWLINTFLSRGENTQSLSEDSIGSDERLFIMTQTAWSSKDPRGRMLSGKGARSWYVLSMSAYNEKTGEMLCENMLSKKQYLEDREVAYEDDITAAVFNANYHQETFELQGALYRNIKTYDVNSLHQLNFESIRSYTDTADTGKDYLCTIIYGVLNRCAYILDIVYTDESMEITEPLVANKIIENKSRFNFIESNNGGRGFARAVERIISERKERSISIKWFTQSKNKASRLLTESSNVQDKVFMPSDWIYRFPKFHVNLTHFQKVNAGKNVEDGMADAITGVVEDLQGLLNMTKIRSGRIR